MMTRNQRMAMAAFEKVSAVSNENKDAYGRMAQKLPVMIRAAGLAQAVGFVETKSKIEGNKLLLTHLAETLGFNDSDSFARSCRSANVTEYLRLTQNALAALLWFKRFSVSVLGLEENA